MKKLFLKLIAFLVMFTALSCGARDETDLVIYFDLLEGVDHYICSIDEDGQNFKKIAGPFQSVTYPASSPDGTRIVFSKRVTIGPDNLAQIWTMNTDGTGMKQETSPAIGLHHLYPTWSTDSQYIYYVQWDDVAALNFSALYRLDIETGQITSDGSHSYSNVNAVACYNDYIAYNDFGSDWTSVLNIDTYADTFTSGISGLYYPTFFI